MIDIASPGLARVLADWGGTGALLAAISSVDSVRDWDPQQLRSRAMRVFALENEPLIRKLPSSADEWFEWIPIERAALKVWSTRPRGRVDWARSAEKGLPFESLLTRVGSREADSVALSVLSWVARNLEIGEFQSRSLDNRLRALSDVAVSLLDSDQTTPTRHEIHSVAAGGGVWAHLSEVALAILQFQREGGASLARRLIAPDLADRFFQLNVLGRILLALESRGCPVVGLGPITGFAGPVYVSNEIEVWWEASSIWTSTGLENSRRTASLAAMNVGQFDRPDIVVIAPNMTLVIECKYPELTQSANYVSSGMSQSLFYAAQLAPGFPRVEAWTIGPSTVVKSTAIVPIGGIAVGIASEARVDDVISRLFVEAETAGGA